MGTRAPALGLTFMRTYVRMNPRPYRPAVELEAAIERGELSFAIVLAREVAEERRRPMDLELALRFLPLIATQRAERYDVWALRWLARWITETPAATIARAAEIARALTELPAQPGSIEAIRRTLI